METLIGRTPTKIKQSRDKLEMFFSDGTKGVWCHNQDCCERVEINDVTGDWSDLIGHPLLVAEERENKHFPPPEYADSYTWTFYTFRNLGGSVDVRWLGESNGYYSERVDFSFLAQTKDDAA